MILEKVKKGKIIECYESILEISDWGLITDHARRKTSKWIMKNLGVGALHETNVRLVELENGKKVWWAEIVDNEWEEKVADWIFDENGKTLLCYPDPREFDRILIELDRKHGYDEFHRPIKKEKTK
ncbi:MAG: hypothetical protein ACE5J3_12945, partial [Methanosarcinales archaeon]